VKLSPITRAALVLGVTCATMAVGSYVAHDAFAQQAPARRVAVVIGVSTYPGLGPSFALPSASTEATRLTLALKEEAHFDEVRLLLDSQATVASVQSLFSGELKGVVGAQDQLLVYFVGHGIGGDFEDPYLLLYDSQAAEPAGTSLSVEALGTSIRSVLQPGSVVIVTDAVHAGTTQDGLALKGPVASQWPDLGPQSLVISASSQGEVGQEGAFAKHFSDAITGGADDNDDHFVSASELQRYLLLAVPYETSKKQTPAIAGRFEPVLQLSKGVLLKPTMPAGAIGKGQQQTIVVTEQPPELDHTIDAVKFVFRDAREGQVQCKGAEEPALCEPYCYVRELKAGACQVSAVQGSRTLKAAPFVTTRGVVICEPSGDKLVCRSDQWSR
jgi:hypothetical protein